MPGLTRDLIEVTMEGSASFPPQDFEPKTAQDVVDEMKRHGGSVIHEWNLPCKIVVRFAGTEAEMVVND